MVKVNLIKYCLSHAGGLEKQTWRIAKAFSKRGIPVQILTAQGDFNQHLYPLIEVKKLAIKKPLMNFQSLIRFDSACKEWLKQNPADIVFGLDRTSNLTHIRAGLGVHAAFLKQRKEAQSAFKSLSYKFNPLHRTVLNLERLAFENPNLKILFTNSTMVKNEVLHYYKTPEEKIKVIHNGVEWHEMARPFGNWVSNKNQILTDLNLDPLSFHFLFVGSGYKRKGLDLLLQALKHLKNEDFHLSVVGKEKEMKFYLDLTKELALSDKVSFFGPQKDVSSFYQMADVLVIPSLYDPNANVTVEALAMGLFVISSKTNGGCEMITEENGKIVDNVFDIISFAATLKKALDHPKTWVSSQRIREEVKAYDFQNQLNQLIDMTLASL